MNDFQDEYEPKPFFWIPLRGEVRRGAAPQVERFENITGRMDVEIRVRSQYLHAGSGFIELDGDDRAYFAFARFRDEPIIPGTGIKGALRSIVEAISNSCVSQGDPKSLPNSHKPCKLQSELCPACRLFGVTGYRGRVHFSDARLVEPVKTRIVKIAELWTPRIGRGRKFYQAKKFRQATNNLPERNHRFVEAVPAGTRFRTTLFFENVSGAEMGLLVRAMGLDRHPKESEKIVRLFPVKLGGAKPRCLGAAHFQPVDLHIVSHNPQMLFASLAGGGVNLPITSTLLEWLDDASLLDRRAWDLFRREARALEEFCPKELY